MRVQALLILSIFFTGASVIYGQEAVHRTLHAHKSAEKIKIDGFLEESVWESAMIADDFIQNAPQPGKLSTQCSEVRVIYTDQALYVGAHLWDDAPNTIMKQLVDRDEVGLSDWFGVILDTYRDGQNGSGFIVNSEGVQYDIKYSAAGSENDGGDIVFTGDKAWDAVWNSAIKFHPGGWSVEIEIPWAALRFPQQQTQDWSLNFSRMIRREREVSFWCPVKPEVAGLLNQSGTLTGIKNVQPPVRLSALPFISTYAERFNDPGNKQKFWSNRLTGGMDLKLGLTDAFTLDMTLVPDFGQVRNDNLVLNLTPFEVRFDENRPFFTEGLELFNKTRWFYSRRIGGTPLHYYAVQSSLKDNEQLISNPSDQPLYNATKITGRTSGGTGIGFLNAVGRPVNAEIKNNADGSIREVQTAPLTNYNVLVLDQNLKNNSYITLMNTNVWRKGKDYDANLTGTRIRLRDKKNIIEFNGSAVVANQFYSGGETMSGKDSTGTGYSVFADFRKISGQWGYNISYNEESWNYDPNDLGFLQSPNERLLGAGMSYNIYEPFGRFNRFGSSLEVVYNRLQRPDRYTGVEANASCFWVNKNFFAFGFDFAGKPVDSHDYFEPRTSDFSKYVRLRGWNFGGAWISTDYRKPIAVDVRGGHAFTYHGDPWTYSEIEVSPRWRVGTQLFLLFTTSFALEANALGYATTTSEGNIIFGRRNVRTVTNTLRANYIFTNKMSFTASVRHYWSSAEYLSFYDLGDHGNYSPSKYNEFTDRSFDAFTVDAVYRWRFAPGSDIFIVWKHNTVGADFARGFVEYSYWSSLKGIKSIPHRDSLSLRLLYYLDYNQIVTRAHTEG